MSQTAEPRTSDTADVFERAFADADELGHLSWAARRIMAMSAALFHRSGAAATSVRDITRACGLSPGALYNHFASKDDLLNELVGYGHDRLESRIAAALADAPPTPVEATMAFVRAYVLGHLEQPELAQVVRREYLHLSPDRYAAIVRRRRRLRNQLAQFLLSGEARQEFELIDGASGATRVAVMILDMCSRTSEWYDPARSEPPSRVAERYVSAAMRLAGASGNAS